MNTNSENKAAAVKKPHEKGGVLARIKGIKHKEIVLAVLAVAVMLIIYFSSFFGSSASKKSGSAAPSAGDYCAGVKTEIEKAVNSMTGKSDANVLIAWESGVESVIAYVTNENGTSSSQSPQIVQGGPIVLKEVYPKALGAVIVCFNGSNTRLQVEIKDMVSTLLHIEPAKIAVYKSNTSN